MDVGLFINDVFKTFVMPGIQGGFIIGFSIYFMSLGISFAYKLISNV